MKTVFYHEPIMVREVVSYLKPGPGKYFLDATLGGGGHSEAILQLGAKVLAWDQDPQAITAASKRLKPLGNSFRAQHKNFCQLDELQGQVFDGLLFDLGVSSYQFDTPERGFSFRFNAPLDMRMDPTSGKPLWEILQTETEEQMANWLIQYGEEPRAKAIARAIVRERDRGNFLRTTHDLVDVIEKVYRGGVKRSQSPATRTFQAFRVAVNEELNVLKKALKEVPDLLKSGGRVAIISFHSLEDRIVKHFFKEKSRRFEETPEWPNSLPNPGCVFRLITSKAVLPSPEEIERNPRARSAKLRVAEKI